MTSMRFKLSWQLATAIVIVLIVGLVPVILYFIDYKDIFLYILSAVIGWTVLVLIALMGAFFMGLAIGHRVASKTDFTPFEHEMLKMKEEVNQMKELLHRHNVHHRDEESDKASVSPEPKARRTSMVEEEPELQGPTDTGPEMKPLGKVRCTKCKGIIPIYSRQRPLEIKCTTCGKAGVLR